MSVSRVVWSLAIAFVVITIVGLFAFQRTTSLMSGEHLAIGMLVAVNMGMTFRILQRLDDVTDVVKANKRAAAEEARRRVTASAN